MGIQSPHGPNDFGVALAVQGPESGDEGVRVPTPPGKGQEDEEAQGRSRQEDETPQGYFLQVATRQAL